MARVEVLDFGTVTFHPSFMLVVMNDGITVTTEKQNILINRANLVYKGKSFVYLTHRINSYAVDTSIYSETSQIENLLGFGVISKNYKAKSNAEIEKLFLKKPFKIFDDLEDAIIWANSLSQ